MSDSSISEPRPSDTDMEQALRHAVQSVYSTGDWDSLTVKRMRKAAEEDLGLSIDFFKQDVEWEAKSKRIIKQEAAVRANTAANGDQVSSQHIPEEPVSGASTRSAKPLPPRGKKRSSPAQSKPRKRQKISEERDLDDVVDQDANEQTFNKKSLAKVTSQNLPTETPTSHLSDSKKGNLSKVKDHNGLDSPGEECSESDMSDVIDDEPNSKPRKRHSATSKANVKATSKHKEKQKKKTDPECDPEKEEIKRLQGWLVKCGIRKMWYKELAPYDNPKAKIRHLKDLLSEAGMLGRYSVEKATQIREARELKSELEAVQAGAKHWGKSDSEVEEEEEVRPKRTLARGLQDLGFLNDDDGEETD